MFDQLQARVAQVIEKAPGIADAGHRAHRAFPKIAKRRAD